MNIQDSSSSAQESLRVAPASPTIDLQGLSEAEAQTRRAQGLGNNVRVKTGRSYLDILRQNVFTFMNLVLFSIGLALVLLGRPGDAIVSVGVVFLNVIVGVIQESRSKHKLDHITLLTRPTVTVVREGHRRSVDPSEIVVGDVLLANPGDQIVVDGQVISDSRVDVDESLLTGESDLIIKRLGDRVYSGSFCVMGSAFYQAEKVGPDSTANQLTASARAFRQMQTPLQKEINLVIRVLLMLVSYFWGLLILDALLEQVSFRETVRKAAVVAGLVPNGLFFLITVTYAMGAVRMVKTGALVQQMNAVESLSNVDVLCLDKTGTLTANRILLNAIYPIGTTDRELGRLLGIFVATASVRNRTSEAIAAAFREAASVAKEDVPFSSARKWSAISLDDPQGTYVLGAPEMLRVASALSPEQEMQIQDLAECGLRVLLFSYWPEIVPLYGTDERPQLPAQLIPLGLISFSDELRPQAKETLLGFDKAGVKLKIISGDNPRTVAALARQAGLAPDLRVISGGDLAAMNPIEFAQAAKEGMIFGRITPQQKSDLVKALRQQNYYVAMIGDGVNDVISLKSANLGIAMQSGSAAARGVADMVLMHDSFAALLPAVQEGQKIVNGMQDILKLFLTRILYVAILLNSVGVVGVAFPFEVKSNSLLLILTVGIPPIAMAAWARPGKSTKGLVRSVIHFVLPAAITLFLLTIGVYLGYLTRTNDQLVAQSAVTTTAILCGLLLIVFVEPPTTWLTGGDSLSRDWRPTVLAGVMLAVYAFILSIDEIRDFFEVLLLPASDYFLITGLVVLWGVILRWVWRQRLFDRFLDVDLQAIPPNYPD